jgi:hypothetical protein
VAYLFYTITRDDYILAQSIYKLLLSRKICVLSVCPEQRDEADQPYLKVGIESRKKSKLTTRYSSPPTICRVYGFVGSLFVSLCERQLFLASTINKRHLDSFERTVARASAADPESCFSVEWRKL